MVYSTPRRDGLRPCPVRSPRKESPDGSHLDCAGARPRSDRLQRCCGPRRCAAGVSPILFAPSEAASAAERLAPLSIDLLDPLPYRRTRANLVEQFAYRYGRTYDAYLATEPGGELFWSRDGRGVVSFARVGRYLHIGGGLLADDAAKPQLLVELVEYAARRKLSLSFYNIPAEDLWLFRRHRFQVTKWGEEALVPLAGQSWTGKAFEWVRRQTNYCRRQGLTFGECRRTGMAAHEWASLMREMAEVAGASPDDKPQADHLRFMQGSFDPRHLGRKRIFVARSQAGAGRLEGFFDLQSGADGKLWVLEVYRHRPDAVRGTVAFLMHQAMQQLAAEGVELASLCLVPGLNLADPLAGDSPLLRRSMVWGTRYFSFIFDAAGLYHFKSRFRPQFESRYVCVFPQVTLGSALAFVGLLSVLKLDARKSLRIALERLKKLTQRSRLARQGAAAVDAAAG